MKDLRLGKVSLRKLNPTDNIIIAELANNKKVWDNVTDLMPHPYSVADANSFINMAISSETQNIFAIEYDSVPCGIIGLHRQSDVFRLTAELGYWIGEPYWNRGITTCAVRLIVMYGFETIGLERIYACVYDFNTASQRVLEKCGFVFEGRSRKAVIKNGIIFDDFRYSIIRDDLTDDYLNK
jgi:[ribosomal protein S5]-alanine N-acetyltransferase